MSDITLNPIGSGYNLSKFNTNFQALEDKINDEILHLIGGNNIMEQSLDMNSNRILNLPEPQSSGEPVRFSDFINFESNLAAEVQARIQGDEALGDRIDSEIETRSSVDSFLQQQIGDVFDDSNLTNLTLPLDLGSVADPVDPAVQFDLGDLS